MKLRFKQFDLVGAEITVDYVPLFFGANRDLCECPLSIFNRKVLGTPVLRREPTTPPIHFNMSHFRHYNTFLCCTAHNQSRLILQLWPRYCRISLFTDPVDSFSSERDHVTLSEPSETPIPKCNRTDNRIASTPLHDMSIPSTPYLSACTILCQTQTDELQTAMMSPEENIELLHDLCFLSVEDFKCLFHNNQSKFSLSGRRSKELWMLLGLTLPPKNSLPSYWRFPDDQKHEFVQYQKTIKTEKGCIIVLHVDLQVQNFFINLWLGVLVDQILTHEGCETY